MMRIKDVTRNYDLHQFEIDRERCELRRSEVRRFRPSSRMKLQVMYCMYISYKLCLLTHYVQETGFFI
jgi:hypothetical protein